MRVLFFHPLTGYLRRGIERTVVSLASSLAEEGHEVSILTLGSRHRALLDALHPRVTIHAAPRSPYAAHSLAVPYYVAHMVQHQYDAVIVFFGGFGVGAALRLAGRLRHLRLYLWPCYPVEVAPHRYAELERFGLPKQAAGIWAAGERVAAQAEERFGRSVRALPQGVDTRRFSPNEVRRAEMRRRLGLPNGAPVLLTVAALEPRKGVQRVIEALPQIRARCTGAMYMVVGEGPLAAELADLAARLGVRDAIVMLDRHDQPEDLYRAADVFCLLSEGEADPMVVYEAIASGVPVVTSTCPPFPQILDGSVALLLPELRPETVAESMNELLVNAERRVAMGKAGRARARERHDIAQVAREVVARIEADVAREAATSLLSRASR